MKGNTNGVFLGCRLVMQVVVEVERYAAAQIQWLVYCTCGLLECSLDSKINC
jgi:hypothetical protein